MNDSPTIGLPPHGADRLHPAISPKRQEEPLPDHPWQLVLGDWYKTKCLVEVDELQGRVHVQLFMPAGVDFMPARLSWQGRARGTLPGQRRRRLRARPGAA